MATERKPVNFNIDKPLEREMWIMAEEMNFSGWVKSQMEPLALVRLAEREAAGVQKRVGVPVPVRKVVGTNGTQA